MMKAIGTKDFNTKKYTKPTTFLSFYYKTNVNSNSGKMILWDT